MTVFFAAQLDSFRITKIGDRILSLHTYEKFAAEIAKLTSGKMGKEYIVIMIPSENKEEVDEFRNETPKETCERFRKRMNALIGELADVTGVDREKLRIDLKTDWVKRGIIKESTMELDVAGYAQLITELLGKIAEKKV